MTTRKEKEERDRLRAFPALEKDDHPEKSGVLLSDEISFYVEKGRLIEPFDKENLKPASYELTVGDEAMLGGEYYSLGDKGGDSELKIPPFEVAVIKTNETVNLPRFLIGRWNIRVKWAYKGLVWVGGPQVDPGYVGHLFCPLYNLSNKTVRIHKGQAIAVMDFVKTTRFMDSKDDEKYTEYKRPPKRVVIENYDVAEFQSALFDQARDIGKVNDKIDTFTTLVFLILAILMTAVTLPYLGIRENESMASLGFGVPLFFSFLAIMMSGFSLMYCVNGVRRIVPKIIGGGVILLAIAIFTISIM